jgi:hypothetical protein
MLVFRVARISRMVASSSEPTKIELKQAVAAQVAFSSSEESRIKAWTK